MEIGALAIIKENYLLVLYKLEHQHYEFPGGKFDPVLDRNTLETALRETKEEVDGIEVEVIRFFNTYEFDLKTGHKKSDIYLAYVLKEGIIDIKERDKFDHLTWISIEEFDKYPLAPNVVEFCMEYLGYLERVKR